MNLELIYFKHLSLKVKTSFKTDLSDSLEIPGGELKFLQTLIILLDVNYCHLRQTILCKTCRDIRLLSN